MIDCLTTNNDEQVKLTTDNDVISLAYDILKRALPEVELENESIKYKGVYYTLQEIPKLIQGNIKKLGKENVKELSNRLASFIGLLPEGDEIVINNPNDDIIYNDVFYEMTGRHAKVGTFFYEEIGRFMTPEQKKEFNYDKVDWKGIYSNLHTLSEYDRNKYINLMRDISEYIFGKDTNIIIDPLQPLDDVMRKKVDSNFRILQLNSHKVLDNIDEIEESTKKGFMDYVKTPFRKFMFGFLLDNLKYKFGIDYKFVKNKPFKARLYDGVVEINEDLFTDEDPFHEYLHAIILALKKDNPELYNGLLQLPEVQQLAAELSRNSIYAQYPEEEAIVRILSAPFVNVSYKTLFQQFIQWLKNLFAKLFNKQSMPISLDMTIGNISNLLLNNNRYLLDTNYIKNYERWSSDTNFDTFKKLNTGKLTSEQQKILDELQKNQDILVTATKETKESTYEFTFPDSKKVIMSRPTSFDKRDLSNLPDELALFGTFSHEIFSAFLKIILENKDKISIKNGKIENIEDLKDNFIFNIELKTNKKNKNYYVFKNGLSSLPGKTQAEEQIFYDSLLSINNILKAKKFTEAVVKIMLDLMNKSNPSDKQKYENIFNQMSHVSIMKIFENQLEMLQDILTYINSQELIKINNIEELLIFSELFVHNYDGTKQTDLLGGTMDIVIITPSGNKYLFDIKTKNQIKVENMSAHDKLWNETQQFYGVQQSIYRDLLSNATNSLPITIQSGIIYTPRMIAFKWSPATITSFKNSLKNIVSNHSLQIEAISKTDIEKVLQNLYYKVGSTSLSLFSKVTKDIILKYGQLTDTNYNENKIGTYYENLRTALNIDIYKPDNIVFQSPSAVTHFMPVEYNSEKLNSLGIKIINEKYNNSLVKDLTKILNTINFVIYRLTDKLNILNAKKLELEKKGDVLPAIEYTNIANLSMILNTLVAEKIKVEKLVDDIKDDIDNGSFDIKTNTVNVLEQLGKNTFPDYIEYIERMKYYFYGSHTLYKKYIDELNVVISDIKESIKYQRTKYEQFKNEISKKEKELKKLLTLINSKNTTKRFSNLSSDNSLNTLTQQYLNLMHELELLETNVKNSKAIIDYLTEQSKKLSHHKSEVWKNNGYNNIKIAASDVLREIISLLDNKINDFNIPSKERASYYKFIRSSFNLYSNLSTFIDMSDADKDSIISDLAAIQSQFGSLEEKITNSLKNIIADTLSEYEMTSDLSTLLNEKKQIESNIILIKNKIEFYNKIFNDYDSQKDQDILDKFKQNLNQDLNNRLETLFLKSRATNIAKIANDFKAKEEVGLGTIISEMILPADRSKYTLIQLLSVFETEINQKYANRYNLISNEIQEESMKFVRDYNRGATDNSISILGNKLPYDRYTAYDKLIARHIDKNFEDITSALNYLFEKDDKNGKYKYELVFDEEDMSKIKGLNLNQIRAFVNSNFSYLKNKYYVVKTLSLIDRVKYGFMDMFKEHNERLHVDRHGYKKLGVNENERIKSTYLDLMDLKFRQDNMYNYDIRKSNFKDYLKHIAELLDIYEALGSKIEYYSDNLEKLSSKNLKSIVNDYLNGNIDYTTFKDSIKKDSANKPFNTLILSILEMYNQENNNLDIDDLESQIKERYYKEIMNYYGNVYGGIFIIEGSKKYSKYIDELGRKSNAFKSIEDYALQQHVDEMERLKILIKDNLGKPEEISFRKKLIILVHFYNQKVEDSRKENIADYTINNQELEIYYEKIKDNKELNDRYLFIEQNNKLISILKNSPFVYGDIAQIAKLSKESLTINETVNSGSISKVIKRPDYNNVSQYNISNLLTTMSSDDIAEELYDDMKLLVTKKELSFSFNVNKGYSNSFENGTNKHFDNAWNEVETNPVLANYYLYVRDTLNYLYTIIPYSERGYSSKLDLPFLDDASIISWIETAINDKGLSIGKRKELLNYIKEMFIKSTTHDIQSNDGKPLIVVKPIRFESIEEMRETNKRANYQLDHLLQIFAYNALLYRERTDKFPLSEMIVTLVEDTKNASPHLIKGVNFNHFVNNTGIYPIDTSDTNLESRLTDSEKKSLMYNEFMVAKLESEIAILKENLRVVDAKLGIEPDINIPETSDFNEKKELYVLRNTLNNELKINEYKLRSHKSNISRLYASRKLNANAVSTLLINSARKVQLTYSLTGQFGNLLNGLIQTSIVASGTDAEIKAYAKAMEILNDMMFGNKVMLGTAYAGNVLTSAVAGSLAGTLSIPMWIVLANTLTDKMKNLNWVRSKFTEDVRKAVNMEINYNVSFDVVEQARANKPETRYYKIDNSGQIVRNENDFVQLISPFGFVKRAEKLIVIQNMLIQSFVTKVKLNINGEEKEYSWWDLHGEDGKLLPEFEAYVDDKMILDWNRKLSDRLYKANGNYTSKYQLEQNWWGRMLLVYAKWIPETMRNYIGGYTPKEEDIYSEEEHEGILVSAYKEGIEQYYKLIHKEIITDMSIERKIIEKRYESKPKALKMLSGISDSLFERIIIFRNGNITVNNNEKNNFVDKYNELVDSELTDEQFIAAAKNLINQHNIKVFRKMTESEKKDMFSRIKDIFMQFILPFDFGKSMKDKTITRNVSDRLRNVFGEDIDRKGYDSIHHANLRRFFNFTHIMYSMFFTKTMLLILFGYLGKILDMDDDDDAIKNMKFIINRYNQLWKDVTYYSNPLSAYYKFFHNGLSTVKFLLDLGKLNIDIVATMPHLINLMLGDSEIGDITLEALGLRDPILEKSRGITNIRPVNDFIDMIPLLNKMSGIYKQSMNDYSAFD